MKTLHKDVDRSKAATAPPHRLTALGLLGHPNARRLTEAELERLWRCAFGTPSARDLTAIEDAARKIGGVA